MGNRAIHRSRRWKFPTAGFRGASRCGASRTRKFPFRINGVIQRNAPWSQNAPTLFQGDFASSGATGRARACPEGPGSDRHRRCGRCVRTSALRAVGQSNHCRIRDLALTLQRQGVQAIAALERDDRPTIRERVPRRLPDGTGNRTANVKQTDAGALHTSRTALARVPPTVMRRRGDSARRGWVVCTCSRSALG